MTAEDFLIKYDHCLRFSTCEYGTRVNSECEQLANCWHFEEIDSIDNGSSNWQRFMTTIFKVGDRYFGIDWQKGLTELQENYYDEQPYEVVPKKRKVTITEWIKKDSSRLNYLTKRNYPQLR